MFKSQSKIPNALQQIFGSAVTTGGGAVPPILAEVGTNNINQMRSATKRNDFFNQ